MEIVILFAIAGLLCLIAAGYLFVSLCGKIKGLFCARQMQKESLNYRLFRK